MASFPVRYRVIGYVTIGYGLIIALFWCCLGGGPRLMSSGDLSDIGLVLLFLGASPALLVAGLALCNAQKREMRAAVACVVTSIILGLKAVLAAMLAWKVSGSSAHPAAGQERYLLIMGVVVIPCAIWAIVLLGTAFDLASRGERR